MRFSFEQWLADEQSGLSGPRGDAEIAVECRLAAEGLCGAVEDERATRQDVRVLGDGECPLDVLLDNEQADTVTREHRQEPEDLVQYHRSDAERYLVDDNYLRRAHIRSRQCEHLLFAAAHRAGDLIKSPAED